MKIILKLLAAFVVVMALAAALTYISFYLLYAAVIISVFYTTLMWLIIGVMFAGFSLWIGRKVFSRGYVYSIRK